ncbi:MAG: hypothetical protein ACTSRK_17380 [Promethearchaeota archaeon]
MLSNNSTIILDIGEGFTKVGYVGEDRPRAVFPTVVGIPKYQQMAGAQSQEIYVGDDTTRMRGVLKLEYPIHRATVMNWDHYYAILNHIFYNVLRIEDTSQYNIIYIVPPLTPPDAGEYFARVLFETHRFAKVAIIDSATTAIFSVGLTTGLSMELGSGISTIAPIMDGTLYDPSIRRLNIAGSDVEEYLNKLLTQYGIFKKREIIKDIKEKCLKITLDPTRAAQDPANAVDYLLPDGEKMHINEYITVTAAEVLFSPQIVSTQSESISQAVINSLLTVNPNYIKPLLQNIVITGGTSLIPGFKARLIQEISYSLDTLKARIPIVEPIPKKEDLLFIEEKQKMVQLEIKSEKTEGNCPKCGEMVNFVDSEFCPFCGIEFKEKLTPQIDILGTAKQQFPTKCPQCNGSLDGESPFCNHCGSKLESVIVEDKLDRKERRLLKKTGVDKNEFEEFADEITSEYDSDELEEIIQIDEQFEKESKEELRINIIFPQNRINASYRGASILGALPSFRKLLISYETFSENPNAAIVDFSKVFTN